MTDAELAAIHERLFEGKSEIGGDLCDLLDEVERLRAFIEKHAYDGGFNVSAYHCLGCQREVPHGPNGPRKHYPDCELVELLGREPKP